MYRREKGNPSGEEVDDEVDGWDRQVEVHFSFWALKNVDVVHGVCEKLCER